MTNNIIEFPVEYYPHFAPYERAYKQRLEENLKGESGKDWEESIDRNFDAREMTIIDVHQLVDNIIEFASNIGVEWPLNTSAFRDDPLYDPAARVQVVVGAIVERWVYKYANDRTDLHSFISDLMFALDLHSACQTDKEVATMLTRLYAIVEATFACREILLEIYSSGRSRKPSNPEGRS